MGLRDLLTLKKSSGHQVQGQKYALPSCNLGKRTFRALMSPGKEGIYSTRVGNGSTCSVDVIQKGDRLYAAKRINATDPSHEYFELVRRMLQKEYNILRALDNPNVVKALGLQLSKDVLFLEYIPYSVYNVMTLELRPSLKERQCLLAQLCCAVQFLHGHGIVHRDLKLENMMLAADCHTLKLIDFGHAIKIDISTKGRCHGMGGSELLMAPEVLTHLSYLAKPVDLWSMGIIMYQLFSDPTKLKFPWRSARSTDPQFATYVKTGQLEINMHETVCRRLLEINPGERMTVEEAVKEPFFQFACDDTTHDRTRRLCHRFWGGIHKNS